MLFVQGLGLPATLVEPEGGWPVVILQHGITSKKEDMLALTGHSFCVWFCNSSN